MLDSQQMELKCHVILYLHFCTPLPAACACPPVLNMKAHYQPSAEGFVQFDCARFCCLTATSRPFDALKVFKPQLNFALRGELQSVGGSEVAIVI